MMPTQDEGHCLVPRKPGHYSFCPSHPPPNALRKKESIQLTECDPKSAGLEEPSGQALDPRAPGGNAGTMNPAGGNTASLFSFPPTKMEHLLPL